VETRSPVKRISIMIGEQQHEKICDAGINISAFIRDLIDDHFSDHTITLQVSKKTHDLYTKLISNTGATDQDVEPIFVETLKKLFEQRLEKIKGLRSEFK